MSAPINGRRLRVVAFLGAVALVTAACNPADWATGGSERPWWCDPTDIAINDGHAGHTGHMPYTEEKGPLSQADCLANDVYLQTAAAYASQFPTARVAETNGWRQLAPWIPGQGTHHVNIARGVTSQFDPTRPNMLMYDSNSDSGKLTGMVYVVRSGAMPPSGFPGNNDHWHFHEKLCYVNIPDPYVVGDNISDSACAARGGTNIDSSDTWLLHVWLPVYEGWQATDIFNKTHPTV